jgi:hypothetical protein
MTQTPANLSATELLAGCRDDIRFFSNGSKDDRERWIFDRWCAQTGRNAAQGIKGESPDFTLNDEQIEIVEVLEPGRKRHKEFKDDLTTLHNGASQDGGLVHDGPGLETTKNFAHKWLLDAIRAKHKRYGPSSASWTLLVYADFTFANRTDWQAVVTDLNRTPPGFARIEILFPDGTESHPIYPSAPPPQA